MKQKHKRDMQWRDMTDRLTACIQIPCHLQNPEEIISQKFQQNSKNFDTLYTTQEFCLFLLKLLQDHQALKIRGITESLTFSGSMVAAGLSEVNANFIRTLSPFPGPRTLPEPLCDPDAPEFPWEDNQVESQHHYQQELWEIYREITITWLRFSCHGKPWKCVSLWTFDRMSFLTRPRLTRAWSFFSPFLNSHRKILPFDRCASVFNKYNRRIMTEDIFYHRILVGCVRLFWTPRQDYFPMQKTTLLRGKHML